jgi:hypothetical protein
MLIRFETEVLLCSLKLDKHVSLIARKALVRSRLILKCFHSRESITDWLTLNYTTHSLDQFAQLPEDTHLSSKKYHAELTPLNIFSQIEFMMYGMNCLALLLIPNLSLCLKND